MRNTSAFQPKSATGLNSGLIAYWRLDESSGNALDSIGGITLTNNNTVTYTSAKIANGADFGTANTNKSLTNTTRIGTVNMDRTISVWAKINTDKSVDDIDTFLEWAYGGSSNYVGYQLIYERTSSVNKWRAYRDRGCVGGESIYFNNPTAAAGFYHLVLTITGTTMELWVNGTSAGTVTVNTGNGSCNAQDGFYIGSARSASAYASVTVDEVGIWNRALSSTEITELYNAGSGKQLPSQSLSTKAYYPLNGNSRDFSGNTNTGTDTAITYPQGRFGQAAKFNGSSSKILIGSSDLVPTTAGTPITISTWFKANNAQTAGKIEQIVNLKDGFIFSYDHTSAGFKGAFSYASSGAVFTSTGDLNIKSNIWINAICIYNGTNIYLYIDGKLASTNTISSSIRLSSGSNYIGLNSGGAASFFNGLIDEVIIESRAWTAAEVSTYYRKSMLNYKQSVWAKFLQAFTISESVSLTETITNLRARNFSVSETTTLTESITSALGKIVTIVESISLTETLNTARSFIVNILESIGLIESSTTKTSSWEITPKDDTTGWTKNTKDTSDDWTITPKN
jgi:hypothetical protein